MTEQPTVQNTIGMTIEQVIEDTKFLNFPFKADKLELIGADEVTGTQLITARYCDEDLSIDEVHAWEAAGKAADDAQAEPLAKFTHLAMNGYIHREDPTKGAVCVEMIYLKGDNAKEVASALKFKRLMQTDPMAALGMMLGIDLS